MLEEAEIRRVLPLHEKSYALLRWTKNALRLGTLSFAVVHDATDSVDAAQEWICEQPESGGQN